MVSESSAFCPGHVTAFFEPVEHADPFKKGSRGDGCPPPPAAGCVASAHAAEVTAKTGLGDVVPASLGAMDIRLQPGAPPHGVVRRLPAEGDVLLAVLGAPIQKPPILSDRAKLRGIAEVGGRCVKGFSRKPSMADLFGLGR